MNDPSRSKDDPPVKLPLGRHDTLVINDRYEALSIVNDILIAIFFVAGSVLFYFESLAPLATTLFLLGSIDFLLRPVIRLARRMHLKRMRDSAGDDWDY